ncbi:MAG: glycoside hydrolase family 43 protein [Cyclobacteriaceae bacterium]
MHLKLLFSISFLLIFIFNTLLAQTGHKEQMNTIAYQNPVIPGFHPDPSVCRVGNDYYLVTSSFEFFPGIPVFHSKDLVHWKQIGRVLTRKSQVNLEGLGKWSGIYAPSIRYHEGVFYVASTNVNGGGNFYVTATNPAGPWSDPVWVDQHWFDPSLFFDDDGKTYYLRRGNEGAVMAEINLETGQLLAEPKTISSGFVSTDMEGPHLYKINGFYYLMAAEGGTRATHMETIGRSKNIWGPYEPNPANPILSQHKGWTYIRATGHGDLIQAHDGSWWMTFLATRHHSYDAMSHLGRETFLAKVKWVDGWPVVKENVVTSLVQNLSGLQPHPWPEDPVRDDFAQDKLKPMWNFLRNPSKGSWSLTARQGYLQLTGNKSNLSDIDAPAFVGRRQQHFNCTVRTKMAFDPKNPNEEAGLTTFLNYEHHYDMFVGTIDGKKHLIMRKTIGDLSCKTKSVPISGQSVILEIVAERDTYQFRYSEDGELFKLLDTAKTQYLGTELASVFTGTFFAMYATGNGQPSQAPADFDWFDYEEGAPVLEIRY